MHFPKRCSERGIKANSFSYFTDDLHEVNEVKTILNVYIKLFGSEHSREVLEEIESQASKHMSSEQTNKQLISSISNITSIQIVGKNKRNIDLLGHDISPSIVIKNGRSKWMKM